MTPEQRSQLRTLADRMRPWPTRLTEVILWLKLANDEIDTLTATIAERDKEIERLKKPKKDFRDMCTCGFNRCGCPVHK